MNRIVLCCALSLLIGACKKETPVQTTNADNTRVNVKDRDSVAPTPLDQKENKADINTTSVIRSKVVDTKMSTNAQNIKIITQDGKVTLRGPVKDEAEKDAIDKIARQVAGDGNVDNQLEIKQKS
jgi:hyperosmotically inducible protein